MFILIIEKNVKDARIFLVNANKVNIVPQIQTPIVGGSKVRKYKHKSKNHVKSSFKMSALVVDPALSLAKLNMHDNLFKLAM